MSFTLKQCYSRIMRLIFLVRVTTPILLLYSKFWSIYSVTLLQNEKFYEIGSRYSKNWKLRFFAISTAKLHVLNIFKITFHIYHLQYNSLLKCQLAIEVKKFHNSLGKIAQAIGTSLQVLPSLWSADFLQNWRQEIPQIIAQNS